MAVAAAGYAAGFGSVVALDDTVVAVAAASAIAASAAVAGGDTPTGLAAAAGPRSRFLLRPPNGDRPL